jgi:2'-5' RNA ligase superfamily
MKSSALKVLPSYLSPVQELYFMISPPRHIMSDVSVLKDDVHYLIGHKFDDQFSKAHIPLFKYSDQYAKDMIRFVESKASGFQPFNILLKDFGVFYHGSKRTVYMDIVYKSPIQEVFEALVKEDANYIPHITIAKNLSTEDYLRCWPYLKSLNYGNQHFLCDRITVLTKKEKQWVHYKDILFGE